MAKTSTLVTQFRRRREGKTNYKKRLAMLKSALHRFVARKTNNYIIAQLIEFSPEGDKTVVHVNSKDLEKFGWTAGKKNIPAAYLTGLLAGVKAKEKKVEKAAFDIGFTIPKHKGWWSAVLKGALDSGLAIKAGEEALPSDERIGGKHIGDFAKMSDKKGNAFSKVSKKGDITKISEMFEKVKKEIVKEK